MTKIILKTTLAFIALLFVNCASNDDNTVTPEVVDPRLPNQELFKPAIQLVPKKQTAKSTGKSALTTKRLVKMYSFRLAKDQTGNEIQTNISDNRYTYDSKGRLNSVDRFKNNEFYKNITKFNFNDANQVTSTYYADIVAEINSGGFISKVTAPDGIITDITYDEIGRDIKEVANGTYTQEIEKLEENGDYTYTTVTNPFSATYLYSYDGNKVFVNIVQTEKNFGTIKEGSTTSEYEYKDKVTNITYELTVDYTKAGVYSSEPIFRCYIYDWMHIVDWKFKAVSNGVTEYEQRYDYEYVYDADGYLTESKRTTTNIANPLATPYVLKTLYTYE
ncbi:hypothetical protein [Flavobacterium pectinovorum]|uniref:YD repeat-containing protein n=1 Tax=Flavobacterium pectinovorum TaxID=29533 RepID=A0A502F1U9_9FLAO|nr:hypothetical protein [Flavobacterium pectinovorum]TPG44003.1 hypothetical protein EAH81_05490 [Flavobacterium pectinovorum]